MTSTAPSPAETAPDGPPSTVSAPTRDLLEDAVKPVITLLANVTVVTALLVYFGWRRAETHADRLGIDESVLGMTTREYILRSVGPVLALLVGIAACGLAWIALERRLTPRLCHDPQASVPTNVRLALTALKLAWLVLPGLVYLLGVPWPAPAFVLFPASIGAGTLLAVYAGGVHSNGADPTEDRRARVTRACAGLLVLVCLFWTASNYAELLGHRLADDFVDEVDHLAGVVVSSEQPLFLDGPGVDEDPLPGPPTNGALRYRYEGLRLLEHTGGRYFLVSDGWTPSYGVVFVLEADDVTIRLDFVRDRR